MSCALTAVGEEVWWAGKGAIKGAGKGRRVRNMHEMLPNWALEKHAWLGAGLMWKRIWGSSTGVRKPEKNDAPQTRSYAPLKALPLIPIWDQWYMKSTHQEFEKHNGVPVLTELNDVTCTEMTRVNRQTEHGMVIGAMDHPYLLSPPRVPLPGATNTRTDTVKVMAFLDHGIVYSHGGLSDPAIMPEYVAQVRDTRASIISYATLEPELPTWTETRKRLSANDWDVGKPMQAYTRPTGKEKSMVCNEESQKWEEAPVPEKGAPEEEKRTSVHLKRGPGMAVDEPKAKKGSVSTTQDPAKMKSASEVEMEGVEGEINGAEKAKESSEPKGDAGEKRPHTPRSGLVLRSAKEVQKKDAEDPGEKAPHGDSSDEEDEQLAENLRRSTSVVALTPREGAGLAGVKDY